MCCLLPQLQLEVNAELYKKALLKMDEEDRAVFEERRLQDVLMCRVQAPVHSLKDHDLHSLWQHRLSQLLDKRELCLQVSTATHTTRTHNCWKHLRQRKVKSDWLLC